MVITSLQNPQIKKLVKIRDRRKRDQEKLIIIEGYKAIRLALENGFNLQEIYYCPELYLGINEPVLVEQVIERGAKPYQTTTPVFAKLAYRDRPEGLIAVGPQFDVSLARLSSPSEDALFLVAEAIEKPGNLGTMLRSADAAGVSGVIVCDGITDVYNPNVVRASVGTLFTMPVVQTTTKEFFDWSRKNAIRVVATTPDAQRLFTETDLSGKLAIAVGAEQFGLSEDWLSRADEKVRIPMLGKADSLNVSAAAALALFEAVRQRQS